MFLCWLLFMSSKVQGSSTDTARAHIWEIIKYYRGQIYSSISIQSLSHHHLKVLPNYVCSTLWMLFLLLHLPEQIVCMKWEAKPSQIILEHTFKWIPFSSTLRVPFGMEQIHLEII